MNTILYEVKKSEINSVCLSHGIKEMLVTYITDPINDPSAEEVENHLLDCRGCRDFFLTMLKMRSHAAQAEKRGRNSATRKMDRADLIRFSDFRK